MEVREVGTPHAVLAALNVHGIFSRDVSGDRRVHAADEAVENASTSRRAVAGDVSLISQRRLLLIQVCKTRLGVDGTPDFVGVLTTIARESLRVAPQVNVRPSGRIVRRLVVPRPRVVSLVVPACERNDVRREMLVWLGRRRVASPSRVNVCVVPRRRVVVRERWWSAVAPVRRWHLGGGARVNPAVAIIARAVVVPQRAVAVQVRAEVREERELHEVVHECVDVLCVDAIRLPVSAVAVFDGSIERAHFEHLALV
mmetsp:Transcript_7934/g.20480  ORF Transcript_7934/g.20480 Transcript_7934/m.20480 type:complete len:256 (+) Transcript_7934:749-1516(+)